MFRSSELRGAGILAITHALPPGRLANEELEQRFGAREMAAIVKMCGVRERRVVVNGLCASDLALTAAERLLRHTGFDRSLIDLLLFVSQTPDYRIPTTAAVLHGKLRLAETCAAFDVNQACSAYPYVLAIAHSMIAVGTANYALILNADALTTLIHPRDRSLVPLHGDAGCATLCGPCEPGYGIEALALGTDGSWASRLIVPAGGARQPSCAASREERVDGDGCVRTDEHLRMDGAAIFHFSVYKVPGLIKQALEDFRLTMDDLDLVILHQANRTMLELIYRGARVPREKQFYYLEMVGNSSGPATPVALSEAWRQGRVRPGSRTLLCSFGAGLSWGTAVIRWPETANAAVPFDPEAEEEILSATLWG